MRKKAKNGFICPQGPLQSEQTQIHRRRQSIVQPNAQE